MFAPPRNALAFLTSCSVSDEKDFALCGGRPKGSSPFGNLAGWAQLDQLHKKCPATFFVRRTFLIFNFASAPIIHPEPP
ncbi:MAG: hypothetical protein HDT21_14050 [Ruminococcus sp.]|nr:hypothetical protein [Ruminococcus sp.]